MPICRGNADWGRGRPEQRRQHEQRAEYRHRQRQRQQPTHLGRADIGRQPQAAKRAHRRQRTEHDPACGRRLQVIGKTGAPVHHKIDVERDADPEQQRQRDDVGVIELLAGDHGQR
jgi:hypothetical protein